MADETTPSGLHAKLADVMASVGRVEKRGFNRFHNYEYVTESDVMDALREELGSRGVTVIPKITSVEMDERVTAKGGKTYLWRVGIDFVITDAESRESITVPWYGVGIDPEDKGLYKAVTGGEKYLLMKMFLLSSGDDPERDGGDESGGEAPKAKSGGGNGSNGSGNGRKPPASPPKARAANQDEGRRLHVIEYAERAGFKEDAEKRVDDVMESLGLEVLDDLDKVNRVKQEIDALATAA